MSTVLSTKILGEGQKAPFREAGIKLVEYNAISIDFVSFSLHDRYQNFICTSKNAIQALLAHWDANGASQQPHIRFFCVGDKTAALLHTKGYVVVETATNSASLAKTIIEKYRLESFLFPCGNLKREELPQLLAQHQIALDEVEVYRTEARPQPFDTPFTEILFFSPSAVRSHASQNTMAGVTAFCLGHTTAQEAQQYTDRVMVAQKPSVEAVVNQVLTYLKSKKA